LPTETWTRLVSLVERRGAQLHHALLGARLRRAHLEDLGLDVQLVARAHRPRPAELVEPGPDDTARGLEVALDQEPHGHRRRVPAARREPAEERRRRRGVVQVKRLRIELGGEALDPLFLDAQRRRAEFLPDGEIFQIAHQRAMVKDGGASTMRFLLAAACLRLAVRLARSTRRSRCGHRAQRARRRLRLSPAGLPRRQARRGVSGSRSSWRTAWRGHARGHAGPAAASAPDGYTPAHRRLANMASTWACTRIRATTRSRISRPWRSSAPLPYALVARKDLAQSTLREVLDFARANPGQR
jgi:hypothetical protein